mgnify:FL=1
MQYFVYIGRHNKTIELFSKLSTGVFYAAPNCHKATKVLDKIRESSKYLAPFVKGEHTIGIILGTGLGELGKSIEIEHAIPYMAIPNFPVSTVQGHRGELLIGSFGGKKVIAMQGRFHYYEGYSMKEVTFLSLIHI